MLVEPAVHDDEAAALQELGEPRGVERIVGLDARARQQEPVPLVSTNEALGDVNPATFEPAHTLRCEAPQRPLEGSGRAADGQEGEERERVEPRTCRSAPQDGDRPAQRGGRGTASCQEV